MAAVLPPVETVPVISPKSSGRRWISFVIWAHLVLVLFAVATVYYHADKTRRATSKTLAVYSKVPEFSLIDSHGAPFGSRDLEGYAWIASFATTAEDRGSNLIVTRLQELQDVIQNAPVARLITFSLNPDQETPERLNEFAKKHRKTGQWIFLTGSRAEIVRVMREGFRLLVGTTIAPGEQPLPPNSKLVLIDREGNIRGYYDASKIEEVRALASDIGQTLQ